MNARLQLALVLLMAGACFSPSYQEGLACSESGACPGDLQCIRDLCVSSSADEPRADSGPGDPDGANELTADASITPNADAGLCLAGTETIDATASIVDFVVPDCVTSLTIEVFGAEGGSGNAAAVLGGKGARMKGDFAVSEGEVLRVLVGMRGADGILLNGIVAEQGGGTGGGGSFVTASNGDAMIVAGGGGGATHLVTTQIGSFLFPGNDAGTDTAGQSGGGSAPGVGGTVGQGGGTNANMGYHSGTGGGGFLGAGLANSVGIVAMYGTANGPGASFGEGGAGGIGGSKGRNGGFGGGGASGFTGGGGGGYSGGGSGGPIGASPMTGGGGGGSFNAGTNPDNSPGARVGDGQVIMTWQGAP